MPTASRAVTAMRTAGGAAAARFAAAGAARASRVAIGAGAIAIAVAVAVASCGPATNVVDTSQGSYACDAIGTTGARVCRETSWAGGAYASTQWAEDCKANLGVQVDRCDRGASIGGCQSTISVTNPDGVGIQIVDTYWFYTGRVETIRANCRGAWIAP